ncbi:hypothetical protein H4582DRAFT_2057606 [Lactarius indigo]|nr:hypothetical protein H4582DRAFT_2057606 [Lactarius indigo]
MWIRKKMKTDDDSYSTTSTTPTIMAEINVWCLVIDRDHKPALWEPFPVAIHQDNTIHELKIKIISVWRRRQLVYTDPSEIGIWQCKRLSAKIPLNRMKKLLSDLKFSDDEDSDVQQLGVAQKVMELELKDDEILLVQLL